MFGKLEERYRDQATLNLYLGVVKEAEQEFASRVPMLTVFHKILIDRVADSYVRLVSELSGLDNKSAQETLQKWLNIALDELHSVEVELKNQQKFYEKVVEVVDQFVRDPTIKRELLLKLRDIADERG